LDHADKLLLLVLFFTGVTDGQLDHGYSYGILPCIKSLSGLVWH